MDFDKNEFNCYLRAYNVVVPTRMHSKNVLESKHRILRDIYLRLKPDSPDEDPVLLVAKMFRVSNDLYGNSVASAHEFVNATIAQWLMIFPAFYPRKLMIHTMVWLRNESSTLFLNQSLFKKYRNKSGYCSSIHPFTEPKAWHME